MNANRTIDHPVVFGSTRASALLILFAVAAAVCAGVLATFAPAIAAMAAVFVISAVGLWIALRYLHVESVSGKGIIAFQLALGLLLVSMVRISERDPTSSSLGIQAIFEFSLQGFAGGLLILGILASRTRINLSPALILWIVFGIFAIVSAYWAPQPLLAGLKAIQLIAICVMAATIAAQFVDRYQAIRLLAWFTVLIILAAILIQGVTEGFGNLRTLTGETDGRYRLILLAIHPIHLGSFAGIIAILLLIQRPRGLDWLAIPFLVGITVMTGSRGPMGVLFLVIIFYAILRSRINVHAYLAWSAGILMSILVLTAGLLTLPGGTGADGPSSTFGNLERDITTLNGRIPLWKAILARMDAEGDQALSPLIGHGYASFRHFGLSSFAYGGDAHNAIIHVFSELGLIGAVLWLLAIGVCVWQLWNSEVTYRARLIATLPIFYIMGSQMMDASLGDSRSFLLVILVYYAHVGWSKRTHPRRSPSATRPLTQYSLDRRPAHVVR